MPYQIHLFCERSVSHALAKKVQKLFIQNSGPISVVIENKLVSLPKDEKGVIPWDDAFNKISDIRKEAGLGESDLLAVLTQSPNENNWFAAQDPKHSNQGFIHVDDFSWITSAPPEAIIAHLLLHGFLNHLLFQAEIDWKSFAHFTPRGCFNDLCVEKKDLNFSLRTADICGDCLSLIGEAAVADGVILQTLKILEVIRSSALGAKQYLQSSPVFDGWPFPVAITKHKVAQSTHLALRLLLMLDHFDSLVRYSVIVSDLVAGKSPVIPARPSLGWWVEQLSASCSHLPELKKVAKIANEELIVSIRNECRGHGWLSSDEEVYRETCHVLELALARIEDALLPILHNYSLVYLTGISMENGEYIFEGVSLSGSHILHSPMKIQSKNDPRSLGVLDTGKIYLIDETAQYWWDCSPYIIRASCPKCLHDRILVTDGPEVYIDTQIGHRVKIPCCQEDQ